MAERVYVALDLGAESGRAVAGRFDGETLGLDVLHRFPTGPVPMLDTLYWDFPGLFRELVAGLAAAAKDAAKTGADVRSAAVDSWGVDFGFLDKRGQLLGNPVHYRDARTQGMPEKVYARVPRGDWYAATGLQTMVFNTLFQLEAVREAADPRLDAAETFLHVADLVTHFLAGVTVQEKTLASTSQMYDAKRRDWARDLLERAGLPTRILPPLVAAGVRVGTLLPALAEATGLKNLAVATAGAHDTASAVAATPGAGDDWLFLSSGTWSLLGAELPEPELGPAAAAADFTNEAGVGDTVRLLKNIMGLWILQECRRDWEAAGQGVDYAALARLAEAAKPFPFLIHPDDPVFFAPGGMTTRLADYCRRTGQTPPATPGEAARGILESLALSYRAWTERIAGVTGRTYRALHIVGGGSQNELLNQCAADATGLAVHAGPVEATALGNCLAQLVADGELNDFAEGRELIRRSCSPKRHDPDAAARDRWEDAYGRYTALAKA